MGTKGRAPYLTPKPPFSFPLGRAVPRKKLANKGRRREEGGPSQKEKN